MEPHTGQCHCGAVTFDVELDLAEPAIECNCSHCQAKGLLLQFVPEDSLQIQSGEEMLTEYRFNTQKIQHLFCSACGVQPFAKGEMPDGAPTWGVNLRAVHDIDVPAITRTSYNGKDM